MSDEDLPVRFAVFAGISNRPERSCDEVPVVRVENQDGGTEVKLTPDDQVTDTVAAFAAAVPAAAPLDEAAVEQARLLDEIRRTAH
ncbi:hypothetical protein OG698_48385 (plasmid) [Streptomyces sp. NBC_01003]|uniref:hypothetical protein n=1 Tax=Streptomyces sp. NBC_01003 TaxID=2903714 RepID=UPI0038693BF5|nr:hypothetical protein OG698_48385 [Streptomyces sp. NBC_01003]